MKRFAITEGRLPVGGDGSDFERLAERCAELGRDGVDFLLVREKQLPEQELYGVTRRIRKAMREFGTVLIVAGRPQVALAAGAHGVHVGTDYERVREARRVFAETWVSCSCHSLAEIAAAKAAGADLCLFGPVFGKTIEGMEVKAGVGLEALRGACLLAGKSPPVFALGGVHEENAAHCVEFGAQGVAGIRMFFGEESNG